jgi:hypothetical protein
MSTQIPASWPDIEAWFIGFVTPAKIAAQQPSLTGVVVRNQKPTTAAPYRQIIIAADYGQNITPITRYVRIRLQAWAVKDNNVTDLYASFDLANAAAYIAQLAPRNANPIVAVEIDAGPSRVKDTLSGIEYQAVTLLLEVAKL